MKVKANRRGLLDALAAVGSATAGRTTVPELRMTRMESGEDGSLSLSATDLEIYVTYRTAGAEVERAGVLLVSPDRLRDWLKKGTDDTVTIEATAKGALARSASGKVELVTGDPDKFPPRTGPDPAGPHWAVSAGTLRKMAHRTLYATAKDDKSFALSGALFELDGTAARMVTTDVKRMPVQEGEAVPSAPDLPAAAVLVPEKALAVLLNALGDDAEPVRIAVSEGQAAFATERATITTALIVGRFPPYRDIIKGFEKPAKLRITLPAPALLTTVERAAVVCDDEVNRVTLTITPGRLVASAASASRGEAEETLELPGYDGPAFAAGFQPNYLTEFLKAVGDGAVLLKAKDGKSATVWEFGADHKCLIVPLNPDGDD